jgi:hypothetical protein
MQSGMFRLPGKKALLKGGLSQPEVVVMDVTETPGETHLIFFDKM